MPWKTTLRREADVLTRAGRGPCRGAGTAGTPPSPLGPLELALWRITTEASGQTSHAAMPRWVTSARLGPPASLTLSSPRRGRSLRRARRFCSPRWRGTRGRAAPAEPSPSPCATRTGGCGLNPPLHPVELVMAGLDHLVLPETPLLDGRTVVLDVGGKHELEHRPFSCGARAPTISLDVGVTSGASSPPMRAPRPPRDRLRQHVAVAPLGFSFSAGRDLSKSRSFLWTAGARLLRH